MSANKANKTAQARSHRKSRASTRGSPFSLTVVSGPSTRINPDTPFRFQRRSFDQNVTFSVAGGFATPFMPGTPGSAVSAINFSSNGADVVTNTYYGVWNWVFQMQSVIFNDIVNFWTEFQIEGVEMSFESLVGDSALNALGPPEVYLANDPTEGVSNTLVGLTQYGDTKRQVLTLAKPHRIRFRPRPSIIATAAAAGVGQVIQNNVDSIWFTTLPGGNVTTVQFYGLQGAFRNFNANSNVRVSTTVQFRVRRPR